MSSVHAVINPPKPSGRVVLRIITQSVIAWSNSDIRFTSFRVGAIASFRRVKVCAAIRTHFVIWFRGCSPSFRRCGRFFILTTYIIPQNTRNIKRIKNIRNKRNIHCAPCVYVKVFLDLTIEKPQKKKALPVVGSPSWLPSVNRQTALLRQQPSNHCRP